MTRSAEWYPAGVSLHDGEPVVLDDGSPGPMFVMKGATGLEAPPWTVTLRTTPGVPGARWDSTTREPRTIRLPVYLSAPSRAEMRELKSMLIAAIDPEAGPGILVLSEALGEESGTVRCIDAIYDGGLEGDETAMHRGPGATWWEFTVQFIGLDHWYSPDPAVGVWVGPPSRPTFPLVLKGNRFRLNPFGLNLQEPLLLEGDAASWATVSLYGPWWRFRLTNESTGQWWEMTRGTDNREPVKVITKPGEEQAFNDLGENRWGFTPGSQFFAVSHRHVLSVQCAGGSSSTRIVVEVPSVWRTAP